ncbi:MAG: hypothetical protein QOF54_1761 [Solirubrobacteraceae bacterium]|nr:hypothetical protein [Solirubrobacteraceae bacterium]
MRSHKLVGCLAAIATAGLALLPVAASAAKGQQKTNPQAIHNGSCRLTMLAAPRFLQAGEAAAVHGALTCKGQPVSGQAVTLFERSAGTPGLANVGTATTTAPNGEYTLSTPALSTNSVFYVTAQSAHSPHRPVKVMPKVAVSGPPDGSQLFTGPGAIKTKGAPGNALRNVVRFSGKVSPVDAGATVVLQRENAVGVEEWRRIGQGVVDREGNYTIVHKFGTPGDASIRVVVRPNATNAEGASEVLSYEISQAQNPALVIDNSANPLTYGQPVTISGTTASGAGTTLTLQARTRAQSAFAPVATTVSGAGGVYSFTQTPLQNTLYRVTGAGTSSALMFEGVKYALTAAPSASTVQVGQSLTFSGKVTPAVAGHPIYLQVLNPSGIGYHVVQAATVGGVVDAAGNYSITHTFYSSALSPRTFRVKIPGDPQNQGAASQSFQVAITPAPNAVFGPEPAANSAQPHEGQV